MQKVIKSFAFDKVVEDKIKEFLLEAKFCAVNGAVLLTEDTVKGLCQLIEDAMKIAEDGKCESCERIETSEAYEYVCDNPPERY